MRWFVFAGLVATVAVLAVVVLGSSPHEGKGGDSSDVVVSQGVDEAIAPPVARARDQSRVHQGGASVRGDGSSGELRVADAEQREGEEAVVYEVRSSLMKRLGWFFENASLDHGQYRDLLAVFSDVQKNYEILRREYFANTEEFSMNAEDEYGSEGFRSALEALGAEAETRIAEILSPEQMSLFRKTYGSHRTLASQIGFGKPVEVASVR